MFKKEIERGGTVGDTVIAAGVKVEGDFVSEGNVVIEGEVLGSLRTAQDLLVGDRARISADVSATNARIAGEVRGNVLIREKMELTATSHIVGDINAKILIVEAGAQINGRVLMGAEAREAADDQEAVPTGVLGAAVHAARASKAERQVNA